MYTALARCPQFQAGVTLSAGSVTSVSRTRVVFRPEVRPGCAGPTLTVR